MVEPNKRTKLLNSATGTVTAPVVISDDVVVKIEEEVEVKQQPSEPRNASMIVDNKSELASSHLHQRLEIKAESG